MKPAILIAALLLPLGPGLALAQHACERGPVTITCPDGQVWDATAQICTIPLSS
ncbi:MAG: hypothetical protein H6898_04295 [Rhodobacter sp.]|nr:hypothetical protein [Paracoccaceae bacterium]MCC0075788.1 hypothetical protein [Rhodobacter sp.]